MSDAGAPVLFARRRPLAAREAAQYAGTETELDSKYSDVHAKENVVPVSWTPTTQTAAGQLQPARRVLFGERARLSPAQAIQYAGTETELDMKPSDVHIKRQIVPIVWE
jgi:hypothetical protein